MGGVKEGEGGGYSFLSAWDPSVCVQGDDSARETATPSGAEGRLKVER